MKLVILLTGYGSRRGVIPEDGFAPVAAIHEVVDRPFELNPQLARHGGWLPAIVGLCQ
jgi:hypothetical protein